MHHKRMNLAGTILRRATSILFVAIVFLVSWPARASDYYIKFETSGQQHTYGPSLESNAHAWMKVSIVDTFPTNALVHYEGSRIVASAKWHQKTTFYVADVPRSIAIRNTATGARSTLTVGDSPISYSGAPSFLLPDQLIVATGLSLSPGTSASIRIAADMPMRAHVYNNYFATSNSLVRQDTCASGWTHSTQAGVISMAEPEYNTSLSICQFQNQYKGKLSHVIKFE